MTWDTAAMAVYEAVRSIGPSWRGELEIIDALQYLLDSGGDVRPTVIEGYWTWCGTPP